MIIINGPCGIGKSTVAIRLHATLPLSYIVDVDEIGGKISHYQDYEEERYELREAVAFATVDAVLSKNRDVVVEKMIFRDEVLDSYCDIGKKYNADITEIILWASKEFVMKRANKRGYREGGTFTPEKCESFWEAIKDIKKRRANAHVIDVTKLDEDAVLKAVQMIII